MQCCCIHSSDWLEDADSSSVTAALTTMITNRLAMSKQLTNNNLYRDLHAGQPTLTDLKCAIVDKFPLSVLWDSQR